MIQKIKKVWDLAPLCVVDTEFDRELKNLTLKVETFVIKWSKNKDFLSDPKVLKEALDDYEVLNRDTGTLGRIGYYYILAMALDQNNSNLKAKQNRLSDVSTSLANRIRFFEHKLSKVNVAVQKTFLTSEHLTQYRHFLEGLFEEARYLLSEKEENILVFMEKPAMENWEDMVSRLLSKEKATLTDAKGATRDFTMPEISGLMEPQDKKVRDSAAKAYNSILTKYVDIAESEINSLLESKKYLDEFRKTPRPDFIRLLGEDVDARFVDTLVDVVSASNDISADFYKVKAKILGQERLEYHERNVDVGEVTREYSFDESVKLVEETLADLDPDFADIFRDFVENGRIDVFSKEGKSSGGFFIRPFKAYPGYILLNHQNKLDDVKTIAHEMGHAIHYEYISRNQNSLNYDVSLAIAEMASTFMEDFVLDCLKKELNTEDQKMLTMSRLNSDVSSIHRQIACYKFEQNLHESFRREGYLSKDQIGAIFQKEMYSYMGNYVVQSEGSPNWWVPWSHIRNFFYVYSYASGLLLSKAFQAQVKKDRSNISLLKEILKKGASEKPVDTFKNAGIDLYSKEFWQQGLNSMRAELDLI